MKKDRNTKAPIRKRRASTVRLKGEAPARRLDENDWRIIEMLREDGRIPNNKIASELGVSEPTVAARIKALKDHNIMLVTLQRDISSQGFDFQCLANIHVDGREVEAIGRELADLECVTVVTLMIGTPEIFVVFNARDRADMVDVINRRFARIKGIRRVESDIALRITKYESSFGNLAHEFRSPGVSIAENLDEVNEQIIRALTPDARISNREVARQLGVSENTVRQRLRKLQETRAIRIGVVVDAVRTGFPYTAWVWVSIAPGVLDSVMDAFTDMPETSYVSEISGRFNALLVLVAPTEVALLRLLNAKVVGMRGVNEVNARIITQTLKHNFYEVSLRGAVN